MRLALLLKGDDGQRWAADIVEGCKLVRLMGHPWPCSPRLLEAIRFPCHMKDNRRTFGTFEAWQNAGMPTAASTYFAVRSPQWLAMKPGERHFGAWRLDVIHRQVDCKFNLKVHTTHQAWAWWRALNWRTCVQGTSPVVLPEICDAVFVALMTWKMAIDAGTSAY
jgi:hypothetical protein